LISPTPAPTALPSAPAIVQRAYERLRSYGTPAYVVYLADEDAFIYRIAFRASDEMMNQSNYDPKRTSLPPAQVYTAFVGPLSITVHQAVVATSPAPQASPAQAQSSLMSDLKTIAVVTANARPVYKADVRDVETVDNHQDYKIQLTPLSDPTLHALRDLWIDSSTYDVRRADYVTHDFNFPDATVYLTVEFEPVGPYWIAVHWVAIYHFLGQQPPFYRDLRVEKMRFPDTLPDWLFDQQGYELHAAAGDADPLAHLFDDDPAP
jgi:hypothetical protein